MQTSRRSPSFSPDPPLLAVLPTDLVDSYTRSLTAGPAAPVACAMAATIRHNPLFMAILGVAIDTRERIVTRGLSSGHLDRAEPLANPARVSRGM